MDVNNDEYEVAEEPSTEEIKEILPTSTEKSNKIFIVHGHDGETKEKTARFLEKLGYEALILHEQASRSKTIIEKIEKYSEDVDFAIVLYTPDDMGNVKTEAENGTLKFRARQNVVFEHGYLMGKIGRANVIPLVEGNVELPNDISGIVYVSDSDWQIDIAKEMNAAGYEIDFNKLYQ
jgi:predicted nucleotide-binding protein